MPYSIKMTPEDFQVEEIPVEIPVNPNGKYLILRIRLMNWETNHFVSYLSKVLSISRKRITYCGTKDKRAVTTQFFCINILGIHQFNIKDCEILESFRSDRMLSLGDLRGNRFSIRVQSDIDENIVMERYTSTKEHGGFWNYFGEQRFGSVRANTDIVGKKLLKDGVEAAVREYLYDPDIDLEQYRVNLGKTWDYAAGIKEYPEHLQFERAMMNSLVHEENYALAFDTLPKNLKMMFVHAYQSRIFNRIIDLRKEMMEHPETAVTGDYVSPCDSLSNINEDQIIKVDSFNLDHINRMIKSGNVSLVAPLVGYLTPEIDGIPGEIVQKALDEEDVRREDFDIPGMKEFSSTGTFRAIQFRPVDLSISDGWIRFSLGRGMYATTLIKQIFSD